MPKAKHVRETSPKYLIQPPNKVKGSVSKHRAKQKRVISTTEIRRNLSEVIERLHNRSEHAIIEKSGAPVAVLLSVPEYEQLLKYKRLAIFNRLTREIGEHVEQSGLSEQELMSELEETKQEVFKEKYAGLA